ncbi:hypothetical protein ElyMa_006827500 [Elysia marginata]|uniref:Uncharacterized protein n=1 Tax=Elysia marginata TaxID=1093978 RepID=A0AAV4J8K6_9GAST|nr:hypothetical protein ElyMa_006827500 [Elysia marginata]
MLQLPVENQLQLLDNMGVVWWKDVICDIVLLAHIMYFNTHMTCVGLIQCLGTQTYSSLPTSLCRKLELKVLKVSAFQVPSTHRLRLCWFFGRLTYNYAPTILYERPELVALMRPVFLHKLRTLYQRSLWERRCFCDVFKF